jgi:hypothetical protein
MIHRSVKIEIHRDIIVAVVEAICALLLVTLPPAQSLRWCISLNLGLIANYEIVPRIHPRQLVHLIVSLIVVYTSLATITLIQHQLWHAMY